MELLCYPHPTPPWAHECLVRSAPPDGFQLELFHALYVDSSDLITEAKAQEGQTIAPK